MRPMLRLAVTRWMVLVAGSLVPGFSMAQGLLWLDHIAQDNRQGALFANTSAVYVSNEKPTSTTQITIPAGTRVVMALRSPLHTTSGTQGSGIYLETLYPVIHGNQIVIPAHSQVQGDVEFSQRPGHFQRVSGFKFRFTSLIFPNNHVVAIDAALLSTPGSRTTRVGNSDGTLRPVDQTEKVITPVALGAATGALLGSVRSTGVGTYVGAGLGAGLTLGGTLLHRGDEISLPRGTNIEMVLQSPLILEPEQAAFNAQYVPPTEAHIDAKDPRSDSDDAPRKDTRRARPRRSPSVLPWLLR